MGTIKWFVCEIKSGNGGTEIRRKWQKAKKKKLTKKKEKHWWTPGSERREEEVERVRRGRRSECEEKRSLRQTATQSCCTVGCCVWGCLSRDPGHARSEADRAWRTSGGRGQPRWRRGGGSSAEQSHLGKKNKCHRLKIQNTWKHPSVSHTETCIQKYSVGHSHKDLFFHHF